jgi:hypothetical protein
MSDTQLKCVCIACRREMQNLMGRQLQPVGGVAFSSPGHYGSTAFDPMDCSTLEIAVCDECLIKAGRDQIVANIAIVTHREVGGKTWDPDAKEVWETVEAEG